MLAAPDHVREAGLKIWQLKEQELLQASAGQAAEVAEGAAAVGDALLGATVGGAVGEAAGAAVVVPKAAILAPAASVASTC